jgi:hypothetical protein
MGSSDGLQHWGILFLFSGSLVVALNDACGSVEPFRSSRAIPNEIASLKIQGPQGWLHAESNSIQLKFSSAINAGVDYVISKYPQQIPGRYQYGKDISTTLQLMLQPGKYWAGHKLNNNATVPLHLVGINCGNDGHWKLFKSPILVAVLVHRPVTCPTIPSLPGASMKLNSVIQSALRLCQHPKILKSGQLHWKTHHSSALLRLWPPVFLIDGSDLGREGASRRVDSFLSAHSVMDVAWEPFIDTEPLWWVLMPRPAGMPGHLLALIDSLQWRHPAVANAEQFKANGNCLQDDFGCVPGCPDTLVKPMTASGYNADVSMVISAFQRAIVFNRPFQVGPVQLGYRATPPLWEDTHGWTYSFGACPSSFLDCYFLEHSPCPRIRFDVRHRKNTAFNESRMADKILNAAPKEPYWWQQAIGSPQPSIPIDVTRSYFDYITDTPAFQTLYAYLFRPKYAVRREVHNRVEAFNLSSGPCAVMHVRRGDIVMHMGDARTYIPVSEYVKYGTPFMRAVKAKTILLLTDSQTAIEEAVACRKDHPGICSGITFRFLNKKRWRGAEGGWENPFPSGDPRTEFLDIQTEMALAQKCDILISGESGYADRLRGHMCCNSPLQSRGQVPQRCICPPIVRLEQYGFLCEDGNPLLCGDMSNNGGDITRPLDDPSNMRAGNFSQTKAAFLNRTKGFMAFGDEEPLRFNSMDWGKLKSSPELIAYRRKMMAYMCRDIDHGFGRDRNYNCAK